MTSQRAGLHRNDHGHRFRTCHHERCQHDPIARHLLKRLRVGQERVVERPRRITIAQARVA